MIAVTPPNILIKGSFKNRTKGREEKQEKGGERHWERPWERDNLILTHNSIDDLKSEMVYVLCVMNSKVLNHCSFKSWI